MEVTDGEERHVCEHRKDKDSGVGMNLALLKKSGKDLCAVRRTGTGRNAIFFGCLLWVLKKCSCIKGALCLDLQVLVHLMPGQFSAN